MKVGDIIGSYVLTTDASTAGGGQSQWAFARRGDTEYFIKQFLMPTYPMPDGPGSDVIKAWKLERCKAFEEQHQTITARLQPVSGEGGNLVITKAFFRDGAHYYKVTEKIDVSGVEPADIARMDRKARLLVMLTAVHSINTLHKAGLVHGDIKPANLLIKQVGKNFSAKIIDFDNCFVTHRPPASVEVVGDPVYYSPELMRYVDDGSDPKQLSTKVDVFALGVVFWQYMTGSTPVLPSEFPYPAQAVVAGEMPEPPLDGENAPISSLIMAMLSRNPEDRPSMSELHTALKRIREHGADAARAPRHPPVPRIRGKLRRPKADAADGAGGSVDESTGTTEGRIGGKLLDKEPLDKSVETTEGKLAGTLIKKKL